VLLGALSTFGPLSTDLYLPGLPSLARDLSAPSWATQATLSACFAGLAVGQLFAGPISDALGRRRPLLFGLVAYAVVSGLCALAPDVWTLLVIRFLQGLAGAAGIAIARAIVRDRLHGAAAARTYAALMLVTGLAPILAPIAGAQLLKVTDWRGLFVVLAGIGALLFAATALILPETLARAARHRGGWRTTRAAFGVLLRDRLYVAYVGVGAFAFATLMAYIAGSPFVLENVHGLSAQQFSLVFALNAVGILAGRQLSHALVMRTGPYRLLQIGVAMQVAGCMALLVATLAEAGTAAVIASLFVAIAAIGIIVPNATALGMENHPERAGSASGIMGFVQFALGAAIAPLVGIGGAQADLPMALTMVTMSALAGVALRLI